jgi:hypothetical protein
VVRALVHYLLLEVVVRPGREAVQVLECYGNAAQNAKFRGKKVIILLTLVGAAEVIREAPRLSLMRLVLSLGGSRYTSDLACGL